MITLDTILLEKYKTVQELYKQHNLDDLYSKIQQLPKCLSLIDTLKNADFLPIIAEIKRASPSLGVIRPTIDITQQAKLYEDGGAVALSVLTDAQFFSGHLNDIQTVKKSVNLPVLRKDFIVDRIQLLEARLANADAILLIAAALKPESLKSLYKETLELGMTPLIEIHDKSELDTVLPLEPELIGINNRNLKTMKIDLSISETIRPLISSTLFVIGESGIQNTNDIIRLRKAGINGFLIGTLLMTTNNPSEMLKQLITHGR